MLDYFVHILLNGWMMICWDFHTILRDDDEMNYLSYWSTIAENIETATPTATPT